MTAGGDLSDAEWAAVAPSLPPARGRRGRPAALDGRAVLDALLWLEKNGTGWRSLPRRYGPWNSVWRRVARWRRAGLLDALPAALAAGALGAERKAAIGAAISRSRGRDGIPPGPAASGGRPPERRQRHEPARRGKFSRGADA